ncbi:MAG: ferritin [Salinispira sp.]
MKLSENMHMALNEQVAREFTAHFLYRAIAFDLYERGYQGFSAWMENHAREEYGHAEKIITYLKDKNVPVFLKDISLTDKKWGNPKSAIEAALAHEEWLTEKIHILHDLASEENDKTSILLLDWFVEEQQEEEKIVNDLLKRINLCDSSPVGLMLIDAELNSGAPMTAVSTQAE